MLKTEQVLIATVRSIVIRRGVYLEFTIELCKLIWKRLDLNLICKVLRVCYVAPAFGLRFTGSDTALPRPFKTLKSPACLAPCFIVSLASNMST
jgi:hypothetical protein